MQRLNVIAIAILIFSHSPARAADPGQFFGAILGEIGRQIEHQQQKKQLRQLRPLWRACSKGNVAACDRAAKFPNLTNQARVELWRMREAARLRPAYERNFYACQKMDPSACQAALAYRYASDIDRRRLQNWLQAANRQHQQALAEFRLKERICHAGLLSACDEALKLRPSNERAAIAIQNQRRRLVLAKRERQRAERQRKEAVREYNTLRDKCIAGERVACRTAAAHPQVGQADIVFLRRREHELAPIKERFVNFVSNAEKQGKSSGISAVGVVGVALALLVLIAGAIGARHGLLNGVYSGPPGQDKGPDPSPFVEPQAHFGKQTFPLTGHMPTDVRRALYGAQQ